MIVSSAGAWVVRLSAQTCCDIDLSNTAVLGPSKTGWSTPNHLRDAYVLLGQNDLRLFITIVTPSIIRHVTSDPYMTWGRGLTQIVLIQVDRSDRTNHIVERTRYSPVNPPIVYAVDGLQKLKFRSAVNPQSSLQLRRVHGLWMQDFCIRWSAVISSHERRRPTSRRTNNQVYLSGCCYAITFSGKVEVISRGANSQTILGQC